MNDIGTRYCPDQMMGNSVSQQREFYARHRMEEARQYYNGLHYEHQYQHGRLVQRQHGHYSYEDGNDMRVATIAALRQGIKGKLISQMPPCLPCGLHNQI